MSNNSETTRREFIGQSAGAALGTLAALQTGCSSSLMGTASSKPQKQPNIIFVFDDQLRACDVGCYGDINAVNVTTPHMDRLASQGVTFTNSLSTCPLCTPYRGMLQTGRYATHSGVIANWTEASARQNPECIANAFKQGGYDTGFIGKWHLAAGKRKLQGKHCVTQADRQRIRAGSKAYLAKNSEPEYVPPGPDRLGNDYWAAFNFHCNFQKPFYYRDTNERLIWNAYETDAIVDEAVEYMSRRGPEDKPFFLQLAPHPPHPPWNERSTPAGYLDKIPEQLKWRPNVPDDFVKDSRRKNTRCYYAMIKHFDDAMGRLVRYLDESGLSENTILVMTADHGEMLGSRGRWNKMVPYCEAVDIPLIFRWPGHIPAGVRSDALYTPLDHMPTLLSMTGCTVPDAADGINLSPAVLGGKADERDAALMMTYTSHWDFFDSGTSWPEWRGVRTKTHTYAKWLTGEEELYNNIEDPCQMNNLVEGQKDMPTLNKMRAHLKGLLAEAHDEFLPGTAYGDWFDDERNLIKTALGPV
jgi:arylsulfatase A-like enzyme